MTIRLADPAERRLAFAVAVFWAAGGTLSAIQIYARELARGFSPPWSEVLLANLLAWVPWLAIVPAAVRLERRWPLGGTGRGRHLAVHAAAAAATAFSFLLYLALFHLVYLEGAPWPPGLDLLGAEYGEQLGRFFLTVVLLYAAIVLAGMAWRERREERPESRSGASALEPFVARSTGRLERVEPAAVDWIEACGNYARLHAEGRSVLLRRTLSSLAEELAGAGFVRVHRSSIVNAARVVGMRRRDHGEGVLELAGGERIKVSRTYRDAVEKLFP